MAGHKDQPNGSLRTTMPRTTTAATTALGGHNPAGVLLVYLNEQGLCPGEGSPNHERNSSI